MQILLYGVGLRIQGMFRDAAIWFCDRTMQMGFVAYLDQPVGQYPGGTVFKGLYTRVVQGDIPH